MVWKKMPDLAAYIKMAGMNPGMHSTAPTQPSSLERPPTARFWALWKSSRWSLIWALCLLSLGCSIRGGIGDFPEKANSATRCHYAEKIARHAARETSVDLELIMGVMRVESFFRRQAKSRVGARGLMQIMPATGKGFKCGDLYDPVENIHCGA